MMARVVHKFPFTAEYGELVVPWGDVVLVAAQHSSDTLPTVWIDRDTDDTDPPLRLAIFGTGHRVADDAEHVGSAVCADGAFVWHIYRVAS